MNHASSISTNTASTQPARYWLAMACGAVLLLLLFELVIRFFIMKKPVMQYEPGWGIVPQENSYSVHGLEGFAVTHYLAHGEIVTPYNEGISVVVLGDSTTKAAQVPSNLNYVSLTETALRANGISADLHNLGLPGRSIADYVYMAPYVQAEYAPEIIVLQVNPLHFFLALNNVRQNYFVDSGNGGVKLVSRPPNQPPDLDFVNLISHSGLLTLLDFRLRMTVPRPGRDPAAADLAGEGSGEGESQPPGKDVAQLAVREYAAEIRPQIKALQAAYPNATLVFLVIPYTPTFSSLPGEDIKWISSGDHLLANALSSLEGIYMVYTLDAFQDLYASQQVLPRGTWNSAFNYGHLNRWGHGAVAQGLTERLEALLK